MMAALDAGAENFEATEEEFIVYTDIASFSQVREKLEEVDIPLPLPNWNGCRKRWFPLRAPMLTSWINW